MDKDKLAKALKFLRDLLGILIAAIAGATASWFTLLHS